MNPPSSAETFQLAEIRLRESANNYQSPPRNPPYATASGAYQFIRSTWAIAWDAVYGSAPLPIFAWQGTPEQQDACALWLLRSYGANSSRAWKASGPYPSLAEIAFALAEVAG